METAIVRCKSKEKKLVILATSFTKKVPNNSKGKKHHKILFKKETTKNYWRLLKAVEKLNNGVIKSVNAEHPKFSPISKTYKKFRN